MTIFHYCTLGLVSSFTLGALFLGTAAIPNARAAEKISLESPSQTAPTTSTATPSLNSPPQTGSEPAATTGADAITTPLAPPPPAPQFRLSSLSPIHDILSFKLDQRTRYEHLSNDFRNGYPGNIDALLLRTRLWLDAHYDIFTANFELQDSRVYANSGAPLDTTLVNTFEPIQANIGIRLKDLAASGDKLQISAGLFTMDIGSRRFVARNDFRNATNNFLGAELIYDSAEGDNFRAFVTMPQLRRPSDYDALVSNETEFDNPQPGTSFSGLFYRSRALQEDIKAEIFGFVLTQPDASASATTTRSLFTPGMRLFKAPAMEQIQFQLELAFQAGVQHLYQNDSVQNNNFVSRFVHIDVGYTWPIAGKLSARALYDYAGGDEDPNDRTQNRFDPLFGARRFDYGPTSFYGAISRSNLSSPAVAFDWIPEKIFETQFSYRAIWLASARDAWVPANLVDPTGDSGSFIGQQLDLRLRYHIFFQNLILEVGGTYLFREYAPPGSLALNPAYFYSQILVDI